jgi:mannose-6-phosphate isomerase-like protein (cupin superfamily)
LPKRGLPSQLTSFVGRTREVGEALALLRRTRLLTLPGPGGIGKTRLALEVAAELAVDYPEGVWLVDLVPLVQLVLQLKPEVSTPRHVHGGQEFSVVMAGTVALQRGNAERVFGAGESGVTPSGQLHAARNDRSEPAPVAATFILPLGRPLTTIS